MNDVKMNRFCIVFIVLSIAIKAVCTCPSDVCTCKWKGGKQNVECGDKYLSDLPDGIDANTQVLNFTGNNLQYLMSERFFKMELINLQKIFLPRNQLSRIHDRAFRGLSNLVELDLSENMLTAIPSETFHDYTSLMRFILNGNPIREIKSNAFKHLSFLTTLELSNCQLATVEDEAFLGLDNLEWLKLDGNRIQTLQGNHILPQSLHGINMHGNRWNCDCKLIDLHTWLVNYNIPQQLEDPKCMYPERLAGEVIKFLKTDDLACLPEITPSTLYLELTEGRNVSLLCKITSTPDVQITWWFQGHMLQNETISTPNTQLYYNTEEGIEDKRSELFIYNVNTEVNGTFSCIAENKAGRIQANYTIRVIVKAEPVVEEINFSYEYFIIIIVGAGVAAFVIVLICCCIVIKCKRKSKRNRKYKDGGRDPSMQLQSNQIKFSTAKSDAPTLYPILKNGNFANQYKDMQLSVGANASLITSHPHSNEIAAVSSQCCSPPPPSIRNYQDQNPDLINDAESGKQRTHADIDDTSSEQASIGPCSIQSLSCTDNGYHPSEKMLRNATAAAVKYNALATLPQGINNKDMYQHQVDVHLSPGCFLTQKPPYPIGCYEFQAATAIPTMIPSSATAHMLAAQQPTSNQVNCYRTLPHKPKAKLAQNQGVRFSLEAEFLTQGPAFAFDTYNLRKDIRYTVEGYPKLSNDRGNGNAQTSDQQFPSPPDGYKNIEASSTGTLTPPQPIVGILANASMPCAQNMMHSQQLHQVHQQWPASLPGYHVANTIIEQKRFPSPNLMLAPSNTKTKLIQLGSSSLEKDVIPEQSEEEEANNEYNDKLRQLTGPFADSPDEGYVGDAQDAPPDI